MSRFVEVNDSGELPPEESYQRFSGSIKLASGSVHVVPPIRSVESGLRHEIGDLLRLGGSMLVSQALIMFQITLITVFAGRMGSAELAGIGLGAAFFDITGLGFTMGMAAASETLFSQTYGAQNRLEVGVILQRSLLFFFLGFLIATVLNINCDLLFVALGQDPVVSCIARRYLMVFTPGLLGLYLYRLLIVYLRIQNVYWPIMAATGLGVLGTFLINYLFLSFTTLGIDGIAIGSSCGYIIMCAFLLFYIYFTRMYKHTWSGWTIRLFDNWLEFLKLGGAGVVLVASEFVFGEMLNFMAGTMGHIELASQAICFQVLLLADMGHFGFSIACSVRVGTSLGENDPAKAKRTIKITLLIAVVMTCFTAAMVVLLRGYIVQIFTSDKSVHSTVSHVIVFTMVTAVIESVYTNFTGALRGCGRQGLGSFLNTIGMICIGAPVLLTLKFTGLLTLSISWLTYAGTEVLLNLVFLLVLVRTDWRKLAATAAERGVDYRSETSLDINSATHLLTPTRRGRRRLVLKLSSILVVSLVSIALCYVSLSGQYDSVLRERKTTLNSTIVESCKWLL